MYFRIKEQFALRSWKGLRGVLLAEGQTNVLSITGRELAVLLLCDGEHDIEEDETTAKLVKRNVIESCRQGEHPSEWSAYRHHENRYFPKMNLMITGKCNYNCRHCFNAADNERIMSEWGYEELVDLLDQAKDCGIHTLTITGGEPFLHPRFMDIIRAIYERGMVIEDLNTNGYFITQQYLDEFKKIGCEALIKISFDGLGTHDWMRNYPGAEAKTLAAMELCIKNGFKVMSQTQVHRRDLHTLMDTARLLNDMGVRTLRLIRTTETARWRINAPDSCLPLEEYYEEMLKFANAYKDSGLDMQVIIWQLMRINPRGKTYSLDPVKSKDGNMKPIMPLCRQNRSMVAVTSSGDVVPCLQLSGVLEERGIHLGNLHKTTLKELLSEGEYLDSVCVSIHDKTEANPKCAGCRFLKYCGGGCPALGMLFSGALTGEDISKCTFFENGWYQKAVDAMTGWENLTETDK